MQTGAELNQQKKNQIAKRAKKAKNTKRFFWINFELLKRKDFQMQWSPSIKKKEQ